DGCRIARDLQRDGHGRSGRDACGEQCDEPVGHGGHGGQYAAVGDREGCERESGGAGGGDVRGGPGERDDHGRQSYDQREWRGDGGELDAERDRWQQHPNSHVRVAHGEPGHVYGDGDGGHGGDDRGEQSHEPVGRGGDGGQYAAVGDREGRERESGGAGGGDVRGGPGERDDYRRQSAYPPQLGSDGGELDAERHGGPEHAYRHLDRLERQPRDLHGDGDGGHSGDDCGEQSDQPDGDGGHGGGLAAVGDREGCEREPGDRGGSDVRRGARERDDHRREPDHERERRGDGGELDARSEERREGTDGQVRGGQGEPGDLQRDGDGGYGGHDCGEQCDEPVGRRGDCGHVAAVGDREGREWESGGAGGGDVRGGPGERDDHRWEPDHERERRGDGGELDVECHGGQQYADRDVGVALREPGDVHSDGDGGRG